ncbi:NagC family transcriptional regulator [Alloscardovia macacae]|uniref:NagC family transcriptional regulator n=2 Tax=Alloscardovia macacae TaxID=1160091 RepID=A0A1Y2T2M6_9BIFI|nr:NagC family transcriptional regulator [Alloscardovia macacae]OTA30092.1 NagC family transcriptional regulator [Alloscardovia macacae]
MAVFQLLFPNAQLSRTDLTRKLGLSRMAVGEVAVEMQEHRIVREVGSLQPAGRGKPSPVIAIDTAYWRVISVDLSQEYVITGSLVDLCGRIVERAEMPQPRGKKALAVKDVVAFCRRLVGLAGSQDDPSEDSHAILGIGITMPGIIDPKGIVVRSVALGWTNVELKKQVEDALGIPTMLSNVTNAALIAERFLGESSENSMLISLRRGVGSSLCLNDQIVRGYTFTTGEIGHIIVDPQGPRCTCGKTGCLEALLAPSRIRQMIDDAPEKRTQILAQAGQVLGRVLSVSIGLLDVHDICVYGPADIVGEAFLGSMREEVHAIIHSEYRQVPELRRCEQGEDLAMRGQAVTVIRQFVPQIRQNIAG